MANQGLSPRDFGVQYFDNRRKTRGNRNPIRRRETSDALKKARIKLQQDIRDGVHDGLLHRCGISGDSGKFGITTVPAEVKMSKHGGFDTLKVVIHVDVKPGMEFKGRTVLSINTDNMGANIKMVQMGKEVRPYAHVFRISQVTI